jgi:hypothetical protein
VLTFPEIIDMMSVKVTKKSANEFIVNGVSMDATSMRRAFVLHGNVCKEEVDGIVDGPYGTRKFAFVKNSEKLSIGQMYKLANNSYDEMYIPFPELNDQHGVGPTGMVTEHPSSVEGESATQNTTWHQPMQLGETPEDRLPRLPLAADDPSAMMNGGQGQGQDDGLWDVSAFQILIRNAKIDNDLRVVGKTLLSTIDRLGRQIFSFYAHKEEFVQKYGLADIDDLESLLISTFETCGDLYIAITRKSAEDDPELDIANLNSEDIGF